MCIKNHAGLGRAYAKLFAELGAKVVVNDFGLLKNDAGQECKAADLVVSEIIANGGIAVANYDSVEFGLKIIETALQNFGRIDALINNAGILRDMTFSKMALDNWELLHNVHLHGAYSCTAAAWSVFLSQAAKELPSNAASKFPYAIVNTCSAAGIYGNFGQSNYSSAKLALYGFTKTLAKEGKKYGIKANIIAPVAESRMTKNIIPDDILKLLSPKAVAPLVAFLASAACNESGSLFEVGGGFICKMRIQRSVGFLLNTQTDFTAEAVGSNINLLENFDCAENSGNFPDSMHDVDWVNLAKKSIKMPANVACIDDVGIKDKVVLITGAGAGLGKTYAVEFAKRGAIVAVSDVNVFAAEKVALEASTYGAKTMAIGNAVSEAREIVKKVVEKFGRIDVLINNAGILRDRSFAKITHAEWSQVYDVHLRGTFLMCQAVWPLMTAQKCGRIINTTSAVGLYGNFGQANYAAAKAGIWGLSNTLAIEGAKNGILVNTIAPNAGTAMTATIMPADIVSLLKPEFVAPMVLYLASDHCKITGQVIEVGSGWHSKIRWQQSAGMFFAFDDLTVERIASKWTSIVDFCPQKAVYPTKINDSIQRILSMAADKKAPSNPNFTYNVSQLILYNIGIGCSVEDPVESKYVYEKNPNFDVVPTFGVIPALSIMLNTQFNSWLQNFKPEYLLHGEHFLKINHPIPRKATLISTADIIELTEKSGKGTVMRVRIESKDKSSGRAIFINEGTLFLRKATPKNKIEYIKPLSHEWNGSLNENNEHSQSIVTIPQNLASIYRLSGDLNPLHIDGKVARAAGYERPILHGMCSFGITAKELIKLYGDNNPETLQSIQARFSSPVYPGDKIKIIAQQAKPFSHSLEHKTVIFKGFVAEKEVINNGIAIFCAPADAKTRNHSKRDNLIVSSKL